MLCRVSGRFFDTPFTGRIALEPYKDPIFGDSEKRRDLEFDENMIFTLIIKQHRSSMSLVPGMERKELLNGLFFHMRHAVFLGEFCLGWIVKFAEGHYKAEPINHHHINPLGLNGLMSESKTDWMDAVRVFYLGMPEQCRTHIQTRTQTIEHILLGEAKK